MPCDRFLGTWTYEQLPTGLSSTLPRKSSRLRFLITTGLVVFAGAGLTLLYFSSKHPYNPLDNYQNM